MTQTRGGPALTTREAPCPQPQPELSTDRNTTSTKVEVDRADWERVKAHAACWQAWWSPGAVAFRAEERERWFQRRIRAVSWDLAHATDWEYQAPIGFVELDMLRYPWNFDPAWTSPMLEHRGGHYAGGPVHWATGEPA